MRKALVAAFILISFSASVFYTQLVTVNGSTTLHVYSGDSIQQAINSAQTGDTVFVHAGTYYETLVVNKSISLIGENRDTTNIDANFSHTNIIDVTASHVTIVGFTIENNLGWPTSVPEPNGINVEPYSNGNNISYNTITRIQYGCGISLERSSDNFIVGNNVINISSGIFADFGDNNSILENSVINNAYGILVEDSSNNSICNNYVASAQYSGIQLGYMCGDTNVIGNTLINNEWGIAISPSINNSFYYNNFINNTDYQVLVFENEASWAGLANYWDNGAEGNYWSGYSLVDSNGDGIGDAPVLVRVQNGPGIYQDHYPLLIPYTPDTTVPSITILSPTNTTYGPTGVALTFTVNETASWKAYSLDGQTNVTVTGNMTLPKLSDGSHSLIVYAKHTAGNTGGSNMIYFTVDATPPSISVISPENRTYAISDIPLTITLNDLTSYISYSLDSRANVTITRNMTLTGLSEGSHSLVIYANYTIGNNGASGVVYFSVSTSAIPEFSPFLILPPFVIATLVVALICRRKRKH
jgi:parallel beta-helix repeat protein